MTSEQAEAPPRCTWAARGGPQEIDYHDQEWGVPTVDERRLFEFLILEGAQAGLSWRTILLKREGYRRAFADFDAQRVAAFDDADQARLLADPGIVRNRLKVSAACGNARAFLEVQAEYGRFASYLWEHVDGRPCINHWQCAAQVPATSALSDRLSKDLRRRGFRFVGSTICYSYLQAMGLVNDHLVGCWRHATVTELGRGLRLPPGPGARPS